MQSSVSEVFMPMQVFVWVRDRPAPQGDFIEGIARVRQHAGWLFQRGNSNEYYYSTRTKRCRNG
jgi:hypothetical protein